MHNIHIDKEVEQRCNEYFKNLENSSTEIKADQLKMENRVEALKEDVDKHLKKICGEINDLHNMLQQSKQDMFIDAMVTTFCTAIAHSE